MSDRDGVPTRDEAAAALRRLLDELPAEFSDGPPGDRVRPEFRVVKADNVRTVHETLCVLQQHLGLGGDTVRARIEDVTTWIDQPVTAAAALQDLADLLGIAWDPPRDLVAEARERFEHPPSSDREPLPGARCAICFHTYALHRADARLAGSPVLCAASVGGGNECGCDGDADGGGQATLRLYDRAALLLGREVAADWWLGYNQTLGAVPAEVLRQRRFAEVSDALDVADQKGWGS